MKEWVKAGFTASSLMLIVGIGAIVGAMGIDRDIQSVYVRSGCQCVM